MIEKICRAARSGWRRLAASIGEDAGTIEDVYEPYLLKNGFIQRTPRGRVVDRAGICTSWRMLPVCKMSEKQLSLYEKYRLLYQIVYSMNRL